MIWKRWAFPKIDVRGTKTPESESARDGQLGRGVGEKERESVPQLKNPKGEYDADGEWNLYIGGRHGEIETMEEKVR